MTRPKRNPLLPPPLSQTLREQKKAEARANALAEFEAKCASMQAESARIRALTDATAREVMTAQLAAIDKDSAHFNGNKRVELVRQLRDMDGLD